MNELANYFPNHTRLQGNSKFDDSKLVILATAQTLARRDIDYNTIDCVSVDEVHEVRQMKAVKQIRKTFTGTFIGMTATPLDSKGKFIGGFDNILDYTSVPYMIKNNYLAPTRFYSVGDITNGLTVKKGEYDDAEIEQAISKRGLYKHIVELNDNEYHWDTEHKTIIFANSIKAGTKMLEQFNRPSVKILHSNLSKKEYEETMQWFRKTSSCVLVNCRILTTGFSEPTVDTLIMLSPSHVKTLCMQTYFRASTVDPNNPNKVAKVYDFGGSLKQHSPYFDDWYSKHKPTCLEQAEEIKNEEEKMYFLLNCDTKPPTTICNGKPPASYDIDNNPYVIDFKCATPHLKPCNEVVPVHEMRYTTTEDKNNIGIIYKWAKCKCGYITKTVIKAMTTPDELIEAYVQETDTSKANKVISLYSKEHNKCLLIIDDHTIKSYKYRLAASQTQIFKICKEILKNKPFNLFSNIELNKLPNTEVNKSLNNLVDLVDYDNEDKNTGLMRKVVRQKLDILNKQYDYKKGLTYWVMKGVNNSNIKRVVNELNAIRSRKDYTDLRFWLERDREAKDKFNIPKIEPVNELSIDEIIPF